MPDGEKRTRTGNRESSVYQGADGWWHGWVWMGHKPNGAPDRRHRRRRTEAAVRQAVRQLERERDRGRARKPGRAPTVEGWFSEWLTTIAPIPRGKRRGLAPRTLDDYWSKCRNWIFPHLGGIRIDAIEPEDLDRLYAAMYGAGKAESHVLKVHAIIRRGLNVAYKREKITRNVAQLVETPGSAEPQQTPLTEAQAKRALEVAMRRRNGLRWVIGMLVGPRQGETLALRWQLTDLDEGELDASFQLQRLKWRHGCDDPVACAREHCRTGPCPPSWEHGCAPACGKRTARWCPARRPASCRQHRRACPPPCPAGCTAHAASCPQRTGGGLVFRKRKGGRDHVVGLPPDIAGWLREHRRAQVAERLAAGTAWEDHDLIFCQENGRPIDPRHDYEEWQSILTESGLPRNRVHALRHTAASLLLELGEDIAVVQDVLGHSDIRTTRGYTKRSMVATRRATARIGTALLGTTATTTATRDAGS